MKNALSRIGRLVVALGILAFALAAPTGCEMVKGAGKDLQSVGEAGQDAIRGDDD